MRFRTYEEATQFIKALLQAKEDGKRKYLTAKLDTIPAWTGTPKDPAKPWVPDGSEIEAVYLSYLKATEKAKKQASPAKLAGVRLERIAGRLVDIRQCKDGTVQVLFVSALRNGEGKPAFRGPNVDKGILAYLAVGEGLGEPVADIIARIPDVLIAKLKALKGKALRKVTKKAEVIDPNQGVLIEVPTVSGDRLKPKAKAKGPKRMKLK